MPNPSNPSENLARHWSDPTTFVAFCDYIDEFRVGMRALREAEGMQDIALVLKRLFDPGDRGIVSGAVRRYTEAFQSSRVDGRLKLDRSTSTLTTGSSGLAITTNTFFGD